MSGPSALGPVGVRKCQKPSRDEWSALTAAERLSYHKFRMLARRDVQLAREVQQ